MDEPVLTGMAAFLSDVGLVVTQVVDWVGDVAATVVSTPILLFTTGFLAIGGAIGIFGRFLKKS